MLSVVRKDLHPTSNLLQVFVASHLPSQPRSDWQWCLYELFPVVLEHEMAQQGTNVEKHCSGQHLLATLCHLLQHGIESLHQTLPSHLYHCAVTEMLPFNYENFKDCSQTLCPFCAVFPLENIFMEMSHFPRFFLQVVHLPYISYISSCDASCA